MGSIAWRCSGNPPSRSVARFMLPALIVDSGRGAEHGISILSREAIQTLKAPVLVARLRPMKDARPCGDMDGAMTGM
jgi:hypothetical protein